MKIVITYGTYDLLHHGHIKLLERAKALGDYLIVGVTSDFYDRQRGKINVTQDVMTRVEAVRKTGLADKIIIEEYEGQKIDDIKKYNVDIFTVGSDWIGKFDYLNDYCNVIYLDRTQGVSSTDIRTNSGNIKLGIVGEGSLAMKFIREASYVNGLDIVGVYTEYSYENLYDIDGLKKESINELIDISDVVYVVSEPSMHYTYAKMSLQAGKHVLCESPIALTYQELDELKKLAEEKKLILMDSIKTAFSMAYQRMILLLKSGIIGDIVSVDATCTSLKNYVNDENMLKRYWGSYYAWGPTALLPIFQLLGTNYCEINITQKLLNEKLNFDSFTKITFNYPNSVASLKVGNGVKSEGELIVTGTKGYAYIPAPWWKNDYFEIRYENQNDNKKFFYKLDGEGIRNELVYLRELILGRISYTCIEKAISDEFVKISERIQKKDCFIIK